MLFAHIRKLFILIPGKAGGEIILRSTDPLERISGEQTGCEIHYPACFPGCIVSVVSFDKDMVSERLDPAKIFRIVFLVDGTFADDADTGADCVPQDILFVPGFAAEFSLLPCDRLISFGKKAVV